MKILILFVLQLISYYIIYKWVIGMQSRVLDWARGPRYLLALSQASQAILCNDAQGSNRTMFTSINIKSPSCIIIKTQNESQ